MVTGNKILANNGSDNGLLLDNTKSLDYLNQCWLKIAKLNFYQNICIFHSHVIKMYILTSNWRSSLVGVMVTSHCLKQYCLISSWYLHVWNRVAVAAYSRLASRSQAKFQTMKLSPLSAPCAAAPAQSTVSTCRSLGFRRATSSQRGRWVGSWPLLLRSIHEDTS